MSERDLQAELQTMKEKAEAEAEASVYDAEPIEKQPVSLALKDKGKINAAITLFKSEYGNAVGTNEFDGQKYVRGVLPWDDHGILRLWDSADDAGFRAYLQDYFGYFSKPDAEQALDILFKEGSFDSLIDRLNALPEWDGRERVGHLFHWFLGADDSPYVSAVENILFNGLVMRGYEPGCKFDYVPVLTGVQGLGKSTFCRLLALDDSMFSDASLNVSNRDGRINLQGRYVVEIAELSSFKPSKLEEVKAFISSPSDDFRELYKGRNAHHSRRTVLIGTTNKNYFLSDDTGNRRFLPIKCGMVALEPDEKLELFDKNAPQVFEQAYAEKKAEYKEKGSLPLLLPEKFQEEALKAQRDAEIEDPDIEAIGNFLDAYDGKFVCLPQIAKEALGLEYYSHSTKRFQATHIRELMDAHFPSWKWLGRDNKKYIPGYGSYAVYSKEGI